jgi:hypothetical protein
MELVNREPSQLLASLVIQNSIVNSAFVCIFGVGKPILSQPSAIMAKSCITEALPLEILQTIFFHLERDGGKEGQSFIQQCRLVSRQFRDAASPFLITKAHVRVTSNSLSRLERLCNHPMYSKSISEVTIYLSCYDPKLSADRSLYLRNISTILFQYLEIRERRNPGRRRRKARGMETDDDRTQEEVEQRLWKVIQSGQILQIEREDFDESSATPIQQLVLRLHSMYRERCQDQETLRQGNSHLARICAALCKFPALRCLNFLDSLAWIGEKLSEADYTYLGFDDSVLRHFKRGFSSSLWSGTWQTAYTIDPPVEMLGELGSQLGKSGIRPQSISMVIQAPANLRCIALSPEQQLGMNDLVSRAKTLSFSISGWARRDSLAENNERSRQEMLALCSLTQCFSSPLVEELSMSMGDYLGERTRPTVSISDILPMIPRSKLKILSIKYVPATIGDLNTLVALQHESVTSLNWDHGWLLDSDWDEALDVLRGLQNLSSVSIKYPRGQRYGRPFGHDPKLPYEDAYSYILKESSTNPLRVESGFDATS